MRNRFLVAALAICVCAFCLSGCGPKMPKMVLVTGSVKVAGELVETGSIKFKPADGQGMEVGGPIKEGKFEVEVPPGDKILWVYGSKVVGEFVPDPLYPDRKANKLQDFPPKVWTEEKRVTVENKKNQVFDVEYTGEGDPNAKK